MRTAFQSAFLSCFVIIIAANKVKTNVITDTILAWLESPVGIFVVPLSKRLFYFSAKILVYFYYALTFSASLFEHMIYALSIGCK